MTGRRPRDKKRKRKLNNKLCVILKDNEHYYLKAQIEQLIIPILEEKLTESQKRDKLSNLLKKMKKNGIIDTTGKGPLSKWYLVK